MVRPRFGFERAAEPVFRRTLFCSVRRDRRLGGAGASHIISEIGNPHCSTDAACRTNGGDFIFRGSYRASVASFSVSLPLSNGAKHSPFQRNGTLTPGAISVAGDRSVEKKVARFYPGKEKEYRGDRRVAPWSSSRRKPAARLITRLSGKTTRQQGRWERGRRASSQKDEAADVDRVLKKLGKDKEKKAGEDEILAES